MTDMKRDLNDAPRLLHRMVLVRRGSVTFNGTEPLVNRDGCWEGTIIKMDPKVVGKEVVDYELTIKLAMGVARKERVITLMFSSDAWCVRFQSIT